jgi:hypothetical protein
MFVIRIRRGIAGAAVGSAGGVALLAGCSEEGPRTIEISFPQ